MDLNLRFQNGIIDGNGADGLDTFVISGGYDSRTMECFWQKIYPTRSPVAYEGYREGKGIWGRWKLTNAHGGFHIWPLTEGGPPDLKCMEEEESLESVKGEPLVSVPVTLGYNHWMTPRSQISFGNASTVKTVMGGKPRHRLVELASPAMPRIVTTLLSHPFFAIGLPHGSEWLYILIFGVCGTILWVAALINCITKESETGNTKIVWVLVIILLGFFGALAYFFIRRPLRIKELGR